MKGKPLIKNVRQQKSDLTEKDVVALFEAAWLLLRYASFEAEGLGMVDEPARKWKASTSGARGGCERGNN